MMQRANKVYLLALDLAVRLSQGQRVTLVVPSMAQANVVLFLMPAALAKKVRLRVRP